MTDQTPPTLILFMSCKQNYHRSCLPEKAVNKNHQTNNSIVFSVIIFVSLYNFYCNQCWESSPGLVTWLEPEQLGLTLTLIHGDSTWTFFFPSLTCNKFHFNLLSSKMSGTNSSWLGMQTETRLDLRLSLDSSSLTLILTQGELTPN